MELNWSLKEIYKSFNSSEFKEDMEKLSEIIKDLIYGQRKLLRIMKI